MIKDARIVEAIRRARRAISERFAHDVDGYIDYLQKKRESSDHADIVQHPSEPPPNTEKATRHKV
ncbi:hypothetical protein J4G02_05420 [Candidatus Poribacteria bacterium]|nr:hypothetical protein [Candidatus Poribacteria bacterium]